MKGKGKAAVQPPPSKSVEEEEEEISDEEFESASNTDDEAAMAKVMELLGPDGLDDYELGEGSIEGEEGNDAENSEGSSVFLSIDGGSGSEEEEEEEDDQAATEALQQRHGDIPNPAIDRVLATFKIEASFWETQTLTYPDELVIPDAGNDLEREVQFYKQSLWAANEARARFAAADRPFTRPDDYYAEMVKSDTHMERIRQRLLDESASLKASDEAKRMRHLKKFGKQVQVAKIQERQKAKKQLDEKVKDFRRKRKGNEGADDGPDFDVTAEGTDFDFRSAKRARTNGPESSDKKGKRGDKGSARMPRDARNSKYGRPQESRRPKQNTKESTEALFAKPKDSRKFAAGGSRGASKGKPKGKGGKPQRPGKSKRNK